MKYTPKILPLIVIIFSFWTIGCNQPAGTNRIAGNRPPIASAKGEPEQQMLMETAAFNPTPRVLVIANRELSDLNPAELTMKDLAQLRLESMKSSTEGEKLVYSQRGRDEGNRATIFREQLTDVFTHELQKAGATVLDIDMLRKAQEDGKSTDRTKPDDTMLRDKADLLAMVRASFPAQGQCAYSLKIINIKTSEVLVTSSDTIEARLLPVSRNTPNTRRWLQRDIRKNLVSAAKRWNANHR